jgi:hypothetical protein
VKRGYKDRDGVNAPGTRVPPPPKISEHYMSYVVDSVPMSEGPGAELDARLLRLFRLFRDIF